MKRTLIGWLILVVLFPATVFALSLDEAKQKGLVGEKQDGYLGLVSGNAGAEAQQLVQSINQGRLKEYSSIAERNGTPVSAVEALAGKKTIEKSPSGYYVEQGAGKWVRK